MSHPVAQIIRTAAAEKWCCEPFCTTCGCLQFRTAIRDLSESVVYEFLRAPEDPELRSLSNYPAFIRLILFHQLPRTEEERQRAKQEREDAWAESEQSREAARVAARKRTIARREQQRRVSAERHRKRQIESVGRKVLYSEIASKPQAERIEALLSYEHLPPGFFSISPDEIDDNVVAQMGTGSRSAFAERISSMRHGSWRALRVRLRRCSAPPGN